MSTSKQDLRTSGDLVMAPRVPHGLAAAVEGLTREVIRHRPEDIYVFAAQHFEELLKLRDEYGAVTNLPGKSANTAALREMNQSLKKRSGTDKGGSKSSKELSRGGWSMNETARVLERHRSIFGDKGRKLSPEEVRALGNEKENKSRRKEELARFSNSDNYQKRRGSNERFVRRKIPPKDPDPAENRSKSDSNGNPKIISQIPTLTQSTGLLAKDIKSELRKNRNSSRDGRSMRERTERKTERLEIAPRQSGATRKTLTRSSHERSLDKLLDAESEADDISRARIETDNQKLKTEASDRSRSFANMPRTLSMDRVREFVVKKFRGSESWEELRSTNYVDRVQEVIDQASPSILRRVKELSTRSAGRCRGYESVDESTSTSTRSDKSNQTDDVRSRSAMSGSRRSRRTTRRTKSNSKSKASGADSLEGIETLASETEQPKERGNEVEANKLKRTIAKGAVNGLSGESDASDYTDLLRKASASSSISLPAVRPPSSKNHSRSVSRSESDNLVLPPIPPEAPRSAKLREELVLPSLQVTKEVVRGLATSQEDNLPQDTEEVELNLPDPPADEIFKDSLNVTPEVAASPRPDSLEPDAGGYRNEETGDNIVELESQLGGISSVEAQGTAGIEERLREIEETEKRIEKILKTESQEGGGENLDAVSVKEKLMEIQAAEERLRDILDPGGNEEEDRESEAQEQEALKDTQDPGMKERLIEIEETEKRIEKILDTETQEIQKTENDNDMKEKLIEIEETEKRIEKILDPEVQKEISDSGIREKLIEIEETEKRIEKILHPEDKEASEGQVETGMKEKLMEIEETEKRIEKIFHSEVQSKETTKDELVETEAAEQPLKRVFDSSPGRDQSHDNAPKTPFIPEIPSEYVTRANQEEDEKHEAEGEGPTEPAETRTQDPQIKVEQFSSGTPDSLGNSYVLTEGSPYDIPDSVTTVIIPERQTDTPSSEILEIVVEDELVVGDKESPEEETREISLRNILDNFGEVVVQEAAPSPVDVDFIKSLKTPNDVVIPRKDLALIAEEEDRDMAEEVALNPVLHDIVERPEEEPEEQDVVVEEKGTPPRSPKEEEEAGDPEVASIQQNATDSGTTESTDEVKETTISDDGGNTAPESSVTSPSCREEIGARNSESSNEVKETTISDRPGEEIGKLNLFSLVPQCHGAMPHVPELNLDSLQDITVSSFQLSDDQTAEEDEEDSGAGQPRSENDPSVTTATEDAVVHESQGLEPVREDVILKEKVVAGEDPCSKVATYVEGTLSDNSEAKTEGLESLSNEEKTGGSEPEEKIEEVAEERRESEGITGPEPEGWSGDVAEKVAEEETDDSPKERVENVESKALEEGPDEVDGEVAGDADAKLVELEKPEEISEDAAKEEAEKVTEEVREEITELVADKTPEEDSEELREAPQQLAGNVHEEELEEKPTIEAETRHEEKPEDVAGELKEEVVESSVTKEPEEKPEDSGEKEPEKKPEDGAGRVSEELHEAEVEGSAKKEPEEGPEEVHEEKPEDSGEKELENKPEDGAGRVSEELHEAEVEGSAKKEPEEGLEEVREEKPEDSGEKKPEKEPEDGAGRLPEEVHEEEPEDSAKEEPQEVHEEEVESSVKTEPEDKSEEKPEDSDKKDPEDEAEKLPEEEVEGSVKNDPEKKPEDDQPEDSGEKDPEECPEDELPKSQISLLETVSLNDFKAMEASIADEEDSRKEYDKDSESDGPAASSVPEIDHKVDEIASNSAMRVGELTEPEVTKDSSISGEADDPVSPNLDPPKAEVVTNDLDEETNGERLREYHIYVPEVTASEELSTTESSTFNSAATKIQAGVRGFLTRRRLQSAQRRSSTLDSVPSIQDSIAADGTHLEPIEEVGLSQAATTIQSSYRGYKARQRLRREDAVQKTTMSVESPFSGPGLQHTGEFHDCLPLPQLLQYDENKTTEAVRGTGSSQTDPENSAGLSEENRGLDDANESQENLDLTTESTTTKEESAEEESTFGLMVNNFPHAHQGLNLVVLSGNDAVLQSQYLNFITSIEEAQNDTDPLISGERPALAMDAFSTLKSTAGIESLPLDNPDTDVSVSVREPLAVPGSPTGLVIEELSKTEEESLPVDVTSASSINRVNDAVSETHDDSLDLPGLSLDGKPEDAKAHVSLTSAGKDRLEIGKSEDVVEETHAPSAPDAPQDASLGTMSFSMNVDDMLGLGVESDNPVSKMKPIFEVTVTPRDLLKLTSRSQGSQASGDRVESPVTMMQIVPKSVDDKSDRSEDERDAGMSDHGRNHPIDDMHDGSRDKTDSSDAQEVRKEGNSKEDQESSDGMSKTFSIEKN